MNACDMHRSGVLNVKSCILVARGLPASAHFAQGRRPEGGAPVCAGRLEAGPWYAVGAGIEMSVLSGARCNSEDSICSVQPFHAARKGQKKPPAICGGLRVKTSG